MFQRFLSPDRPLNIYELCDPVLAPRSAKPARSVRQSAGSDDVAPGENLRRLYRVAIRHPGLRLAMLQGCRHPGLGPDNPEAIRELRDMLSAAAEATPARWRDREWVTATFAPLARLLDATLATLPPRFQRRFPAVAPVGTVDPAAVAKLAERCREHISATWRRTPDDPHFPVAAQIVLSGDDQMTGEVFLDVLAGLGSFEYQNATLLFTLLRAFLLACPRKLALARKPYAGLAEPLRLRPSWIMHRTAFYDVIFFEHLLSLVRKTPEGGLTVARRGEMLAIAQELLRYILITSREWLRSPGEGIRHPAVTCLPKDEAGQPLCAMKPKDWKKKQELGFDDYVPDVDTTFLGLSMARKWLDLAVETRGPAGDFPFDPEVLAACREMLDHPWVRIIAEYEVGAGAGANPPTNRMTKPLDYAGCVPLWFDKPFARPDGSVAREVLGNDICLGHNMDILEAILANRHQWRALEGENLGFVQRLLDFHHRACISGNFRHEGAVRFYLPPTYVYYAGRVWDLFKTMPEAERTLVDPEGKLEEIRRLALDYVERDLAGFTMNAFDAALAVAAWVLLDGDPDPAGPLGRGLEVLLRAAGEGGRRGPFRAYEWTLVRHPSRILVGSEVATSFFVLNACVEALTVLDRQGA